MRSNSFGRAAAQREERLLVGEESVETLMDESANRIDLFAHFRRQRVESRKNLARFLNPIGKIDAARRTGASRKQQARIVQAIKRARFLGLLPYTINDSR